MRRHTKSRFGPIDFRFAGKGSLQGASAATLLNNRPYANKDGKVRHGMHGKNRRGLEIHGLKRPSGEELDHA